MKNKKMNIRDLQNCANALSIGELQKLQGGRAGDPPPIGGIPPDIK